MTGAAPLLRAYGKIRRITDPDVAAHSIWIGVLSFEERCTASLRALENAGVQVGSGLLLNYVTTVRQSEEDRSRRQENRSIIEDTARSVVSGRIEEVTLDPYSFQELQTTLEPRLFSGDVRLAIIDVTCMTKVHALALASRLANDDAGPRWVIAYATPDNYAAVGETQTAGWRDVIVAPLSETGTLFNERNSRGIIVPGHEADRLVVALAEIEPSGGLIMVANARNRPDFRYISERMNRKIVRQLTRMRSQDWTTRVVGIEDTESMSRLLSHEIELARRARAPVILFPYGPKTLLFSTSFQLCLEYPEASWFVYPIPAAYDVNYSEGVRDVIWLARVVS